MRWLPLSTLIFCLSCSSPTTYSILRDPPDYVDRVVEDVTAMIEGMAAAHASGQIALHDQNFRSSRQPKVD